MPGPTGVRLPQKMEMSSSTALSWNFKCLVSENDGNWQAQKMLPFLLRDWGLFQGIHGPGRTNLWAGLSTLGSKLHYSPYRHHCIPSPPLSFPSCLFPSFFSLLYFLFLPPFSLPLFPWQSNQQYIEFLLSTVTGFGVQFLLEGTHMVGWRLGILWIAHKFPNVYIWLRWRDCELQKKNFFGGKCLSSIQIHFKHYIEIAVVSVHWQGSGSSGLMRSLPLVRTPCSPARATSSSFLPLKWSVSPRGTGIAGLSQPCLPHNSVRSLWFLNGIFSLSFSFTGLLQSPTSVWFHGLFYLLMGIIFLVNTVLCVLIHKNLQRNKTWILEIPLDSGYGKKVTYRWEDRHLEEEPKQREQEQLQERAFQKLQEQQQQLSGYP